MEREFGNYSSQSNIDWKDFNSDAVDPAQNSEFQPETPDNPSKVEPSLRAFFLKEINTPEYLEYEYNRKVARSERWAHELKKDISQYKVALADTTAFNIKEKLLISKKCDDSSLKLFKIKKPLELNQEILASKNPKEIRQKKQEIADFEFPTDISGSDEMIKAEIQVKSNIYEREKSKLNEFLKSFKPENLNPSARPSKIEYFQTLAIIKDLEADLFELESEQAARAAGTSNQTYERVGTPTDKELNAIDTSASYLPLAEEVGADAPEEPAAEVYPSATTVVATIPDPILREKNKFNHHNTNKERQYPDNLMTFKKEGTISRWVKKITSKFKRAA